MTLPRLYENVTLHSHAEIRYIDGRPEGYGGGSPFAMGLNTLVSRTFTDYVQKFRVIGDWREHDMGDYKQGRVPDNSMVLQITMRAVLDKMKNITTFSWELNTPPLYTVYQGLVGRTTLTSLVLRCQNCRTPRPTTVIPPIPNLKSMVMYDIDPLCYPDDISMILLGSKKLEQLKLHWSPRMRESGEESVNLLAIFGRCLAARYAVPIKRLAIYNLYTRFHGEGVYKVIDYTVQTEATIINSMDSSDPMTVFTDQPWQVAHKPSVPVNLKILRTDNTDKEGATILGRFQGLDRLYLVAKKRGRGISSKPNTAAGTPTTPSTATPGVASANGTPTVSEHQSRNTASEYLAAIQKNHSSIRHLLLSDRWQLSFDTFYKLCQSCPNLEQLGFCFLAPPLESMRQAIAMVPKLWALRLLLPQDADAADKIDNLDSDMHMFAIATEFWRPEYKNLKYLGIGDNHIYKLGGVYFPPKAKDDTPDCLENGMLARRSGPVRKVELVSRESVNHIEIWGLDTMEFDPSPS